MERANLQQPPDLGQLQGHGNAVAELAQSPGWAVFVQAALKTVEAAKQRAAAAESSAQMAFHTGAALAVEQLLHWPQRELQMNRMQVAQAALDKAL